MFVRIFPMAPQGAEFEAVLQANHKLAGALDMVRETLNGGHVDDLLYIINTALAEHRATFEDAGTLAPN